MSKRRVVEAESAAKGVRTDSEAAEGTGVVAVPRAWLIALPAIVIAPWLIAAGVYAWGARDTARQAAGAGTVTDAVTAPEARKPWGQLEVRPIMISPPLELVPTNWGPIESPQWRFPNTDRLQLERFLSSVGLESGQVAQLLLATRPEPRINGFVVSPGGDLVRQLASQTRAAIYLQLAKSPLNHRQHNAYRYAGTSADEWLGRRLVSPATLRVVEPYVYRVGDFVYFADIDMVRAQIGDGPELQRLAKGLLRQSTLLVRLHVNDVSQVDAAAEYWGRGGRRTDIRPLLESIAAGADRWIDIGHLLPPMARGHLYRYPRISLKDLERGTLVNCFWTALNFFNEEPDDRLLDPNVAFERLKRDYYVVHDGFQLGDIVAFGDSNGDYFHAAVYLADDLVFGKNGTSSLSPWTIVPIERLKGYYVERADDWNVIYYRRKDL
jgi:hypothetical protein